jgi:N6-L-threonylcarbamoyladenine synthase
MLNSGDLDFSFSGLKTAVLTVVNQQPPDAQARADIAAEFQAAIVDVLVAKSLAAIHHTGLKQLVVAGGVGANRLLRERLSALAPRRGFAVFYPELEFCTDNGAMMAYAGAMRLQGASRLTPHTPPEHGFSVRPRWDLEALSVPPLQPSADFSES